ncbi:hypothetical protein NDU88_005810 [Pleurodeles waltl]|uniref:Uncharacterized protein n=1 Tax=Pleurodeles waltl TaxID=8319 RepID=A0AAV7MZ48_PLEWA|nr:hypothetical protein NDU88_005810 [Pleurodeles waltl]
MIVGECGLAADRNGRAAVKLLQRLLYTLQERAARTQRQAVGDGGAGRSWGDHGGEAMAEVLRCAGTGDFVTYVRRPAHLAEALRQQGPWVSQAAVDVGQCGPSCNHDGTCGGWLAMHPAAGGLGPRLVVAGVAATGGS